MADITKVDGEDASVDPLRNPALFKTSNNPERKKMKKKKKKKKEKKAAAPAVSKSRPETKKPEPKPKTTVFFQPQPAKSPERPEVQRAKKENPENTAAANTATAEADPTESQRASAAAKPSSSSTSAKGKAKKPSSLPDALEEDDGEDIFGPDSPADAKEESDEDDLVAATGAGKPKENPMFGEGEAGERENRDMSGLYLPKGAVDRRREIKPEALDKDLMQVGDDEELKKFEEEKKESKLEIEELPDELATGASNEVAGSAALDDDLFNMVDSGAGNGDGGSGSLDISSYIAANAENEDDVDLFS